MMPIQRNPFDSRFIPGAELFPILLKFKLNNENDYLKWCSSINLVLNKFEITLKDVESYNFLRFLIQETTSRNVVNLENLNNLSIEMIMENIRIQFNKKKYEFREEANENLLLPKVNFRFDAIQLAYSQFKIKEERSFNYLTDGFSELSSFIYQQPNTIVIHLDKIYNYFRRFHRQLLFCSYKPELANKLDSSLSLKFYNNLPLNINKFTEFDSLIYYQILISELFKQLIDPYYKQTKWKVKIICKYVSCYLRCLENQQKIVKHLLSSYGPLFNNQFKNQLVRQLMNLNMNTRGELFPNGSKESKELQALDLINKIKKFTEQIVDRRIELCCLTADFYYSILAFLFNLHNQLIIILEINNYVPKSTDRQLKLDKLKQIQLNLYSQPLNVQQFLDYKFELKYYLNGTESTKLKECTKNSLNPLDDYYYLIRLICYQIVSLIIPINKNEMKEVQRSAVFLQPTPSKEFLKKRKHTNSSLQNTSLNHFQTNDSQSRSNELIQPPNLEQLYPFSHKPTVGPYEFHLPTTQPLPTTSNPLDVAIEIPENIDMNYNSSKRRKYNV